jgi:hypothetical protein
MEGKIVQRAHSDYRADGNKRKGFGSARLVIEALLCADCFLCKQVECFDESTSSVYEFFLDCDSRQTVLSRVPWSIPMFTF